MTDNILTSAKSRKRNHAIDLMKFLAALLITNSHMVSLYPDSYNRMATGGAIGDALFFFCSGFLLMGGTMTDFFNWYKRRINRIYPTIIVISIIGIVVFGNDPSFKFVLLGGGGWFVQAILVFYAFFWFVKRFLINKLWIVYSIVGVLIIIWFCFFWNKALFILSDNTYLRWPCFFSMMLLGITIYKGEERNKRPHHKLWCTIILLFASIVLYYGYQLLEVRFPVLLNFQLLLIPVLMAIVVLFYQICSHPLVIKLYTNNNSVYLLLFYISSCCLEIYLSGRWSFWIGEKLIGLFPLNIIICFLLIFCIAYLVKVFSNFIRQTFSAEDYNWIKVFKL